MLPALDVMDEFIDSGDMVLVHEPSVNGLMHIMHGWYSTSDKEIMMVMKLKDELMWDRETMIRIKQNMEIIRKDFKYIYGKDS